MRKIWYLKQESGQKTKTAKAFLYEKNGHVEGRMDLSAFCDCGKGEEKNFLLHMKDAFGKDVGRISLKEGNISYESFFLGQGKLKEELADKLMTLKGNTSLSVTIGKERYLSEGWKDEEAVPEKAGGEREEGTGRKGEEGERAGRIVEEKERTGRIEKEKGKTGRKQGKGESEIEKTGEDIIEELEAEELLQEEREEKRIVQLSVLEDELLFRSYVHNSFLLHGYYNYGHVMIDESGEEPRLGIPGNYYEREQLVAEMFGFPVFEAAKEGEEITNGTFGYFYTKG